MANTLIGTETTSEGDVYTFSVETSVIETTQVSYTEDQINERIAGYEADIADLEANLARKEALKATLENLLTLIP